MKTQTERIIEMMSNGEWTCQVRFWDMKMRSPHKRRSEVEKQGKYRFEERKCVHGVHGSKDYKMVPVGTPKTIHLL